MSNFCKNYTVIEVKKIMIASEGLGPGVGGHAISGHGNARVNVTSRGKSKDSAFERGWQVQIPKATTDFEDSIMSGVFDDYVPPQSYVKSMVHSSDQYFAVCNALNSTKGQEKLKLLDTSPDGDSALVVFETAVQVGSLVPSVRLGRGNVESRASLNKMHIEMCKIGGRLHIHTAYSV